MMKYSEVSEELQGRIDRRIVEVHEQYPRWKSKRIADFVSKEFKTKVSRSVVERNIPEWRERKRERQRVYGKRYREKHRKEIRERMRRYREKHRKEIREHQKRYKRRLKEKLRPYGREMLRIYRLNEGLDDDAIVRKVLELVGDVVSKKLTRMIIRWCRRARKSGEDKYIYYLSNYLRLPCPVIREELEIGYKLRVGRSREVYECLVALGGVATFKELQEALGWDPKYLSRCLSGVKKGLLINGEKKFIRSLLPDFTAPRERLTIWYLPEKQAKAEQRAMQIALEKLEASFRSRFRSYYGAERSRKEAYKLIPFLRKAYIEGSIFTLRDLRESSNCTINESSLERVLQGYANHKKSLYTYDGFYSFHKEKIEQVSVFDIFIKSLFEPLLG
jgi:hypothetical protein